VAVAVPRGQLRCSENNGQKIAAGKLLPTAATIRTCNPSSSLPPSAGRRRVEAWLTHLTPVQLVSLIQVGQAFSSEVVSTVNHPSNQQQQQQQQQPHR
jgi:hypothetical protein